MKNRVPGPGCTKELLEAKGRNEITGIYTQEIGPGTGREAINYTVLP